MKPRTVRFAVYIEEDVDNKLRVYCAEHRVTMSDVANVALESWLASQRVP